MSTRFFSKVFFCGFCAVLPMTSVSADDTQIDVDSIRQDLTAGKNAEPEYFEIGDSFAREDARLEQEEMNLLRELEAEATEISEKDIETAPIERSNDEMRASLKRAIDNSQAEISRLKDMASKSEASAKTYKKKVSGLQSKLSSRDSELRRLRKDNSDLLRRLTFAEEEVKRLSRQLDGQNDSKIRKIRGLPSVKGVDRRAIQKYYSDRRSPEKNPDPLIATVSVSKANLRGGPGKNNSPLMQVARGTRLLVETRQGEWYRVVAPSGARAWVSGQVIQFGRRNTASPSGTIQVQGIR